MTDLQWFWLFALIFVVSVGMTAWMAVYWRRSMKSHADQMKDIIREMRDVIEAEKTSPSETGDEQNRHPPRS